MAIESATTESQLSCWSCCTDRFTESRIGIPAWCHSATCLHASRSTRAPSAWSMPDSSAIGMNSAGPMIPRSGSRQRRSASTPNARPVEVETCGW